MNSFVKKCVLSCITWGLFLQLLWSSHWYFYNPQGSQKINALEREIKDGQNNISFLKHYLQELYTKKKLWLTSHALHEHYARSSLGYLYPSEHIFVIHDS